VAETPLVLIVDDQQRNLDALEAMLSDIDCTAVRAESADEALLALLRHDVAAIILDIQMPGMNGLELARVIKQRRRSQHVPILFLTAHFVDERDALEGYGAGAVDYLSKPINPAILRSKVGVFIELFRKTRALGEVNQLLEAEVGERERAQAELRSANQDLERRVQERTAALSRALQGVRDNEERLRMAMAVSRMAAWVWHLRTGQLEWSSEPEKLFGFPAGSFGADRRLLRALHPDDRATAENELAAALDTGIYEAEYRLLRPDGHLVWITERGRVVHDEHGVPERMVGVSRDVTVERSIAEERERLLRDMREARDEAERQSRLKDEFLATLSHELRTPMNAILGWLSILEGGKAVRDLDSVVSVIGRNARLQARLIDDLLDMNRLLSGDFRLEVATVDVAALLRATLEGLQPAADSKGVTLVAAPVGELGPVHGDARRLQQVIWNLAHNAIKFTSRGGRVEVRAEQVGGRLQIAVQDNGRGISGEFLPHVFERFRQEDGSPTRGTAGLGLGLSIVKHLVELHGGTIEARSAGTGAGATFLVQLPNAAPASPASDGPAREGGVLPSSPYT
jgi:PAS domain S-box-containing protein